MMDIEALRDALGQLDRELDFVDSHLANGELDQGRRLLARPRIGLAALLDEIGPDREATKHDVFEGLGQALARLRERRGFSTQTEAARSVGFDKGQLSRWENESPRPTLENLNRLLVAYGVGLPELVALLEVRNPGGAGSLQKLIRITPRAAPPPVPETPALSAAWKPMPGDSPFRCQVCEWRGPLRECQDRCPNCAGDVEPL